MAEGLDMLVCAATEMERQAFEGGAGFITGVGIPAALARTLAIGARDRPARLLNIGIAGAYPGSGLAIGDIVLGTSEVYGDIGFELPALPGFQPIGESPWGDFYREPLPLALFPALLGASTGRGCTVNACAGTDATGHLRRSLFGAAFETMEGAAVAQAGQILGIPVYEIRAISNLAARREMRPENVRLALDRLREYLSAYREIYA